MSSGVMARMTLNTRPTRISLPVRALLFDDAFVDDGVLQPSLLT